MALWQQARALSRPINRNRLAALVVHRAVGQVPSLQGAWQTIGLPFALVLIALVPLTLAPPAWGQSPGPPGGAWGLGEHDGPVNVLAQGPDRVHKRFGESSEHWDLALGQGTFAYLEHILPKSYVLSELSASVWVRADQTPIQFRVRVVLPKSGNHPGPLTIWLDGDAIYTTEGEWKQLTMTNLLPLLKRQVRVLRLEHGPQVSADGAYIDRAAVNVYTGPGRLKVWLDQLSLEGSVEVPEPSAEQYIQLAAATLPEGPSDSREQGIQLQGSMWMADGRPFFPRVLDTRGNGLRGDRPPPITWQELRERRWNSVWIDEREELGQSLQRAGTGGIWLIAPTPPANSPFLQLSRSAPVLAWQLADGIPGGPSDSLRALQRVPAESRRPILVPADRRSFRTVDGEVANHKRVIWGSSFPLSRWSEWLRRHDNRLVPVPSVVSLDTGPPLASLQQARRVGFDGPTPCANYESLRQVVRWALEAGARGVISDVVVEPNNELSYQRALDTWELMNLELDLLEPWLAGDQPRAKLPTSQKDVEYLLLRTDRASLAVPLLPLQDVEHVAPIWRDAKLQVHIPDHTSSAIAYEVQGDTLRPLPASHEPGGLRVQIAKFSPSQLILITSEPMVVAHVRQKLAVQSKRRLDLLARVYRDEVQRMDTTAQSVESLLAEPLTVKRWVRAAAELGVQADDARAHGDATTAMQRYEMALAALARGARAAWSMVTESLPQPALSPGGLVFDTLPAHAALLKRLDGTQLGAEQLPAGDMEALEQLEQAGWRHWQAPQSGCAASVAVHGEDPRAGRRCVRMAAEASVVPEAGHAAPVTWIQSPPLRQERDGLVLVHGWLRVGKPVQDPDGFLIFDSIGGPAMGLRYYDGNHWQEFAFYRMVEGGEVLQLTFALNGPGQVDIDQVSITSVGP